MSFGYTFIWVDDVPRTVTFYEGVFGVTRRMLQENGNNGWYAELETGPTTLAIADTKEAHAIFPGGFHPNRPDGVPGAFQISFIVQDVPGVYASALAAGAAAQQAPKTTPWGLTIARVQDPNGIFVSIVSPSPR